MKIERTQITVNNTDAEDRLYTISVNLNHHHSSGYTGIESGSVMSRGGEQVARFNSDGGNNFNMSFYVPVSEQPAVLTAVNDFLAEAKTLVESAPEAENE